MIFASPIATTGSRRLGMWSMPMSVRLAHQLLAAERVDVAVPQRAACAGGLRRSSRCRRSGGRRELGGPTLGAVAAGPPQPVLGQRRREARTRAGRRPRRPRVSPSGFLRVRMQTSLLRRPAGLAVGLALRSLRSPRRGSPQTVWFPRSRAKSPGFGVPVFRNGGSLTTCAAALAGPQS